MSVVSEHSEFDYPEKKEKKNGKARWSYNKMLIDWVRLGRTGKYLALGHGAQTSLRSVLTSGQIFSRPARPNSVNKYILFFLSPPTIWSICDAVVS